MDQREKSGPDVRVIFGAKSKEKKKKKKTESVRVFRLLYRVTRFSKLKKINK